MSNYAYILVYSTSHAIRLEKSFLAAGISCKLVPVPRQLSSDCGVCVRIARADVDTATQLIVQQKVEIERIALE